MLGTNSAVSSGHYLTAVAGNSILERGRNAFDAAVAISAVLYVVLRYLCGLRGDAFALVYDAGEGKVHAFNAQ